MRRPALSPATLTVAVLGTAAVIVIYWAQSTSPAPPKRVYAIAFSPDSNRLIAGATDGLIHIWSTDNWTPLATIGKKGKRLNALAVSPDNTTLATAGDALTLWDLNSLKSRTMPETNGQIYGTIKYSPDGKKIATVSASEKIEVWDVESQQRLQQFCCTALYGDVAFDPNGQTLASSGHILRLWSLETGTEIARLQDDKYVVSQIEISPDGKTLAAGSQDRRLRLWDVASLQQLHMSGHEAYVEAVAFSPDSALVASGGRGNLARLWEVATGQPLDIPPQRSTGDIRFSKDGQWLAVASGDSVWLWNPTHKTEQQLTLD